MIKIITKNIVPHHDKIMQYNEQHSPIKNGWERNKIKKLY